MNVLYYIRVFHCLERYIYFNNVSMEVKEKSIDSMKTTWIYIFLFLCFLLLDMKSGFKGLKYPGGWRRSVIGGPDLYFVFKFSLIFFGFFFP